MNAESDDGIASYGRCRGAARTIRSVLRLKAEDVAELPRLVRGAGLRFEGFLDRVFISHILLITKSCNAVAPNTSPADVQGV